MTLKAKLLLIFLAVTSLSLLSVWFLFFTQSRKVIEASTAETTAVELSRLSRKIDTKLDLLRTWLELMRNQVAEDAFQARSKGNAYSFRDSKMHLKAFLFPGSYPGQSSSLLDYFGSLTILDAERRPELMIQPAFLLEKEEPAEPVEFIDWEGKDALSRYDFTGSLPATAGKAQIVFREPQTDRAGFAMGIEVPVLSDPRNECLGYLLLEVNLSRIFNDVIGVADFPSQAPIFVLDRQGKILYHTDLGKTSFQVEDAMPELQGVRDALGKGRAVTRRITLEGKESNIVALQPSKFGFWMIGMISPYGVFYRNAERAGIVGLLFLGIIGVLAATLVVVLTRGITSSASDLRRGTEEFAKGNLAFRIKPSGKDELAELAKAYNAMAESISVHQDALRQRADEIESLYAVSAQLSPHLSEEDLAAIILKIFSPPEGGKKSLLLLRNRFTGKWYRAASQGFHGFEGFSPEPGGAPDAPRTPPELPSLQKAALFSPEEMPGLHAMLGNEPGAHLLAVPLLIDDAMEGLCLIGGLGAAEGTDEERMTFYNNLALQAEGALEKTRMMQDTVTSEKLAALNRTSSLLAHDLKNLITRLTAIAQNVKTMIDDPAFRSRLSFYLEDTIKKFDSTIIRLVTVGSGDRRSLESVDLNEIIGEALRSLNVAQEPGIEVQKELTTVTPIPLYRSDFRRIVENLLRNAVDAMPNGGKLLIATEMAGNDRVRIIVQDTGCGMSKEFLEKKLFQPFATTKRKGMGLGLYAAWETIKECGGTLDVQSQTGVGTTITISLPVRPR